MSPCLFGCLARFFSSACGSGSESGKVFGDIGHPENWASHLTIGTANFHGTAIKMVQSESRGAILFVQHCAPCHGDDARGKIGPNIQGAPASLITFAVTIPIMLGHSDLSQDEIEDIAGYLAALRDGQQPIIGQFDTGVCVQCHGEDFDGGTSRVSCFSCHDGPEGSIGHSDSWLEPEDPIHFHGRYGREFVGGCTACHGVDLRGNIGPSCFICHDGRTAPLLRVSIRKGGEEYRKLGNVHSVRERIGLWYMKGGENERVNSFRRVNGYVSLIIAFGFRGNSGAVGSTGSLSLYF